MRGQFVAQCVADRLQGELAGGVGAVTGHGDLAVQRADVDDAAVAVVADLAGERDARRYAALLISTANGIAGMEVSGQLPNEKWGEVRAEDLIDTLVTMIAGRGAELLTGQGCQTHRAGRNGC